eukprot:53603_1
MQRAILSIIYLSTLFWLTIIIAFEIYKTYKVSISATKQKSTNHKVTKRLRICLHLITYSYIFISYVHSLLVVLEQTDSYKITSNNGCYIRHIIHATTYQTSKMLINCLLVMRLYCSYSGTSYQYSLKFTFIPLLTSIVLLYFCTVAIVVTWNWGIKYDPYSMPICIIPWSSSKNTILVFIVQLVELVISVVLSILFMKSLYNIIKSLNNVGANKNNVEYRNNQYFVRILSKTIFLTLVVIFSTFLTTIIYILILTDKIVPLVDHFINIMAVILMKKNHDKIYQTLCNEFENCCFCLLCCKYDFIQKYFDSDHKTTNSKTDVVEMETARTDTNDLKMQNPSPTPILTIPSNNITVYNPDTITEMNLENSNNNSSKIAKINGYEEEGTQQTTSSDLEKIKQQNKIFFERFKVVT